MRKSTSILCFTGLLAVGYIYLTPYLTLAHLKYIFDNHEFNETEKYIDYKALKSSLSSQLSKTISKRVNRRLNDSPLSSLTIMLFNPIIGGIVDATVNPKGLNLLMQSGTLTRPQLHSSKKTISQGSNEGFQNKTSMSYVNLNSFMLTVDIENSSEPLKLFLRRYGFIKWKLNTIILPQSVLESIYK